MHIAQQLNNSFLWADPNPRTCPCRGSGWLLSDFDTWHECHFHGRTPHPEDDEAVEEFDYEAHRLNNLRRAFVAFRESTGMSGPDFKTVVTHRVGAKATPQEYVDAAEGLAEEMAREGAEAQARREGFSCALEMRLANEARRGDW